jgi:hypothetical protein
MWHRNPVSFIEIAVIAKPTVGTARSRLFDGLEFSGHVVGGVDTTDCRFKFADLLLIHFVERNQTLEHKCLRTVSLSSA